MYRPLRRYQFEKVPMINALVALRARCESVFGLRKESGATMAEYAFLLSLIALVAFAAVQAFGQAVSSLFVGFPGAF